MENKKDLMTEPQVNNYRKFYTVTDVFVSDYKASVESMAYVDAIKVLDLVKRHGNVVNSATLNEIVRIIASFPYKYVNGIMSKIHNSVTFKEYFVEMPKDFDPGF
jgi:hypothetical protein